VRVEENKEEKRSEEVRKKRKRKRKVKKWERNGKEKWEEDKGEAKKSEEKITREKEISKSKGVKKEKLRRNGQRKSVFSGEEEMIFAFGFWEPRHMLSGLALLLRWTSMQKSITGCIETRSYSSPASCSWAKHEGGCISYIGHVWFVGD
jgi:hypothetical protein